MTREIQEEPLVEQAKEIGEVSGVYLAGPIRCVEDNGETWREEFVEEFGEKVDIQNPLDRHNPSEVEVLSDPIEYNEDTEHEQVIPSDLVYQDKSLIQQSEVVFVALPDVIARGSCMEIMYASDRDIPVFVWKVDSQEESPWVYDHSEFMHSDRDVVINRMIQEL